MRFSHNLCILLAYNHPPNFHNFAQDFSQLGSYWHFTCIFCKGCLSGFENGPCKVRLFCQAILSIFPLLSLMLSSKLRTRTQDQKLALGPWWQLKGGTCVFLKSSLDLAAINHRRASTMGQCTAKLKGKISLMDWKSSSEASVPACHLLEGSQSPWFCVLIYIYIHTYVWTHPLIRFLTALFTAMISPKVSWWHHSRTGLENRQPD